MIHLQSLLVGVAMLLTVAFPRPAAAKDGVLRAGIIGCDTSHAIEFTKRINDPTAADARGGVEVTVAYPGGSPDLPESQDRVEGYVKQLKEKGIKIVDSLAELAKECDVVLLESVDGRPHLEQFRAVAHGQPIFVDKPAAGSLIDVLKLFQLADETHTPVYTSSALRFCSEVEEAAANKSIGNLLGCETVGPMATESHHPDLFWYGIHGVEPLYTIMGPGCDSVSRTDSPLASVVVGKWKDGRIGSYRGLKKGYAFALAVFGDKGASQHNVAVSYDKSVNEICKFLTSGKPPVDRDTMIEIYTFMEAADESKRQDGKPVKLSDVLQTAQDQAAATSATAAGGK